MLEAIRCQKCVVRRLNERKLKVMYVQGEGYELIVDNTQAIQFISAELKDLVAEHGSVKLINSIATIVLTYEDEVVMSTFTVRILDQLITDPMPAEYLDVAYFRVQPDDSGTICERSQAYSKLEADLKRRRNELIKLASNTPVDKALIESLDKMFAVIELTKGDVTKDNLFYTIADR
jgi:hypothetical protein